MYSFVLQNWITINGTSSTPIVQTEQDWLEMSPYQDVVAWIDVREFTGTQAPTLALETAPAKDDILFVSMTSTTINMLVTTTAPQIVQFLMGTTTVPVAQFLRWKVTGFPTGTPPLWDVTFRIFVAANAPGLQPPSPDAQLLLPPGM